MNEDKATRYHRLKRRCAVLSIGFTGLVLVGLMGTGASATLRDLAYWPAATDRHGLSPAAVAVYAILLTLIQSTAALPFALYRHFLLERRFGLSSEPLGAWVRDHVKALVLGLVLGVAGAEIVYLSMAWWPAWWWLASAAAFMAGIGIIARVAPVVLLPLFYRFTPLDRESLRTRLVALSTRAGIPVLGVYEWGLGEKTRRANAALVGTGATRRILVSDTLLAEYSDDEIEIILAHELAHQVHHDIPKALLVECGLLLVGAFSGAVLLNAVWPVAGLTGPDDIAGLPLLLLSAGATSVAATPFTYALSRRAERRADHYALTLTRQPGAFVSAMRRLAAQNLAEERPSRRSLWLFHTHPPIEQRIMAARDFRVETET